MRSRTASVNAPLAWPKISDSIRPAGIAPQFTATNGPPARGDWSCTARAISSLPVPDSPRTSTVTLCGATLRIAAASACIGALSPIIGSAGVGVARRMAAGGARAGFYLVERQRDGQEQVVARDDEVVRAGGDHRQARGAVGRGR